MLWYNALACVSGDYLSSATRYAMMRKVAALEAGNFRGVCPIKKPGERVWLSHAKHAAALPGIIMFPDFLNGKG